jgi:hypothetical protein
MYVCASGQIVTQAHNVRTYDLHLYMCLHACTRACMYIHISHVRSHLIRRILDSRVHIKPQHTRRSGGWATPRNESTRAYASGTRRTKRSFPAYVPVTLHTWQSSYTRILITRGGEREVLLIVRNYQGKEWGRTIPQASYPPVKRGSSA